jgi:hypothetical protein
MTLDETVAEFEKGFTLGPEGNYRFAATGEEYVVVCTGGVKPEGECSPVFCGSPELAVVLWLQAAVAYAKLRMVTAVSGFTLYWRIRPELDGAYFLAVDENGRTKLRLSDRKFYTRKLYRVYSRFLVSDWPQIRPAMITADEARATNGGGTPVNFSVH